MNEPAAQIGFRSEKLGLRLSTGRAEFLLTNVAAGDFRRPSSEQSVAIEQLSGIAYSRWAQDEQIHGANVTLTGGEQSPLPFSSPSDGQATNRRDVLCAVRTADCLPVLLGADDAVAALHAGWRGLDAGIVAAGVETLSSVGSGQLVAVIGPGARGCCYQVSEEMLVTFAAYPSALRGQRELDLAAVASEQLRASGVTTIYDCGICTICSSVDAFFSHRRDGGDSGRMLGAAWLN